jgi:hypothetical protein
MHFYLHDTQPIIFVKKLFENNEVFYFFLSLKVFLSVPLAFTQHSIVILSIAFFDPAIDSCLKHREPSVVAQ